MNQNKTYIKKVKAISLGSSMSLILAGIGGLTLQSCNSNTDEADYEIEEKYTQGVKTFITETEPGKFKITDEQTVPVDSSKAVVTYLNGKVEELSKEQSKVLIDNEIANNGSQVGQGFGLGNALLYGGMGYFLARTLSPGYGRYRPAYREDQNRAGGGAANVAGARKYYSNDAAYTKANSATASMAKSRTFTSRPSASRGGFFGGRSSGRSGGFGG